MRQLPFNVGEEVKNKVYGVSELTDVIKGLFKPYDKIFVEGEISGWKTYASGHAYFTLKDDGAQLACVMFASAIARCKAAAQLKDGAKVCLYGRLDVYAPRGSYQLVVLAAKISGEGDLMAKFNELKEKLQREGLFDHSRKRPLPFLPHRIAIVVAGLEFFNRPFSDWNPDVLIVGRGGGSIEDLWAFNEECVVRAVVASKVPVVSAVGHETDFTLCDFAADVRAGTPSIAAEIVVPVKTELIQQVKDLSARLARAPQHAGETFAQRIDHLTLRLSAALRDCAARAETRLSRPAQRLLPALKEAVSRAEKRLSLAERCLSPAMKEAISGSERRLVAAQAKLDLLDPSNPLKRGYSLTLDAEGRIVRSASSVNVGDTLTTRLGEGQIVSTVTKS